MNDDLLYALDEAIHGFRVATQRPSYSRWVLDGLGFDGGVAALRVLRAVERLTAADGGPPSIRQVATELGVEHSTASRLVDGLVSGALLTKEAWIEDKRHARLGLTPRGETVLDQASGRRRSVIAEIVDGWPEQDVETLTRLLDQLRAGFDERFVRT